MKIYIKLGHMTNMAAMPIYGKNLKNLLLQNQYTHDLKLNMLHHVCEYYQSCSNSVPCLTLTNFTPKSIWSHRLLYGKR